MEKGVSNMNEIEKCVSEGARRDFSAWGLNNSLE